MNNIPFIHPSLPSLPLLEQQSIVVKHKKCEKWQLVYIKYYMSLCKDISFRLFLNTIPPVSVPISYYLHSRHTNKEWRNTRVLVQNYVYLSWPLKCLCVMVVMFISWRQFTIVSGQTSFIFRLTWSARREKIKVVL